MSSWYVYEWRSRLKVKTETCNKYYATFNLWRCSCSIHLIEEQYKISRFVTLRNTKIGVVKGFSIRIGLNSNNLCAAYQHQLHVIKVESTRHIQHLSDFLLLLDRNNNMASSTRFFSYQLRICVYYLFVIYLPPTTTACIISCNMCEWNGECLFWYALWMCTPDIHTHIHIFTIVCDGSRKKS